MEFTVISITKDGRQLVAHGFTANTQVYEHIRERVRMASYQKDESQHFELFLAVETGNDGLTETFTFDGHGMAKD